MKIAVLSGKGGTGKTLVSVNLASVARQSVYIDCDVEEPNGHLFFKPKDIKTENVSVLIPALLMKRCIGCRKCVDFCKFNAWLILRIVFMFSTRSAIPAVDAFYCVPRTHYLKRQEKSAK
jgi:MinD superfamily P-loop ATPase